MVLGNRGSNRQRSLDGLIDDFRFYSGVGDANFVENIRQSAVGGAPTVTDVYPNGLMLQQVAATDSVKSVRSERTQRGHP